jgi:hypothetical protein
LDGPKTVALELDAVELQFLEALTARGVRYVLIGSHAGRLYGLRRRIKDLDVLVETTPDNAKRILAALGDLRQGGVTEEQLTQPRKQIRVRLFGAEIFTSMPVPFEELLRDRVDVKLSELIVPVVSREHWLRLKTRSREAAGPARPSGRQ